MDRRTVRSTVSAGVSLGAVLSVAPAASAATYDVTNLDDDGSPGTLREAVALAELGPGRDVIVFSSELTGTLQLTSAEGGELEITYPVIITGPGPERVTINAAPENRVLSAKYPGGGGFPPGWDPIEISGLTIDGDDVGSEGGGAILNAGTALSISDSVITGGQASGGGGIANYAGPLTLNSTTVAGNSAGFGGAVAAIYSFPATINSSVIRGNNAATGGGIAVGGGSLKLFNTLVSGNDANLGSGEGGGARIGTSGYDGGGIAVLGAQALIKNSTITANTAINGGGVMSTDGFEAGKYSTTLVQSTTVADNTASNVGGGVFVAEDESQEDPRKRSSARNGEAPTGFLMQNTIVADNLAATYAPDIYGSVDTEFTLVEDTAGAGIFERVPGSNITGQDPDLGPLADNGGSTETMALSSTSPALDQGNGRGTNRDQRGFRRPVDLNDIDVPDSTAAGADGSDMGAFELASNAFVTPSKAKGPRCFGRPPTIIAKKGTKTVGTRGIDVIVGTGHRDRIFARGGNDLVCGFGGSDVIYGGRGQDRILGRKGNDLMFGGRGSDQLIGGPDNDRIYGGPGRDVGDGQSGRDTIHGGPSADKLRGGPLDDRLYGENGPDRLIGNRGPDSLFGGNGPDYLIGGPGDDLLVGGPGLDQIFDLIAGSDKDVIVRRD